MNKKILIYGIQRSGTNYLEKNLKKNNLINSNNKKKRNNELHKHFRFHNHQFIIPYVNYHKSSPILSFDDVIENNKIDHVIVLQKNIYNWYPSICKWAKKNKWKFSDKYFSEEYIEDYYLFYKFFEDKECIKINYEDLLFQVEHIIDIFKPYGIELKKENFNLGKIPHSTHPTIFYKDKYSTTSHLFKKDIDNKLFNLKKRYGRSMV